MRNAVPNVMMDQASILIRDKKVMEMKSPHERCIFGQHNDNRFIVIIMIILNYASW